MISAITTIAGALAILAANVCSQEPGKLSTRASFVENRGQWPAEIRYAAASHAQVVVVTADALWLKSEDRGSGRASVVRMTWETSLPMKGPVPDAPTRGRHHIFVGNPARWRTGLSDHRFVAFRSKDGGCELRVAPASAGVELTLSLPAGVSLESISLRLEGHDQLEAHGACFLAETAAGPLRLRAPKFEQVSTQGGVVSLAGAATLLGAGRLGFDAPQRDVALPLVINLGLEWGSYLGGSDEDIFQHVAAAPGGDVVLAGETHSVDFPLTPGAIDPTIAGAYEVCISRLDSIGGSLIFSTYLGGAAEENPSGIAVGDDGSITVCGTARSIDFPTTRSAYDTSLGGGDDLFVSRLAPDGSSLVWSTFIGDNTPQSSGDSGRELALAADGSVYVVGDTDNTAYPVTAGAFDTTGDGAGRDVVVSHLSSDGQSLLHSTRLGGSSTDVATAIAWLPDGVVVTGRTQSPDFPTTSGAFDTQQSSSLRGIVTKLDPTLSQAVFSTFLTASGGFSRLLDVAVDSTGAVTVTGFTGASLWPVTPGAYDTSFNGGNDAFVTRFNPAGTALEYSTFLGGVSGDGGTSVVVDSARVTTIAGFTWWASGFPTTPGAWDSTGHAFDDSFVARLSPQGDQLWYSTRLGGNGYDSASSLLAGLDEFDDGSVVVTSFTNSSDFPATPGSFDTTLDGLSDGYVAKLTMLPAGVGRYGASTPGCAGSLAMGVTAMPKLGGSFSMTCRNAPPSSAQGLIVLGFGDLPQPLMAKGTQFWINPLPLLLFLPLASNPLGFAKLGGTLPNTPALAGVSFTVQCFWPDACAPSGPLSASNALAITLQP